MVCTYLAAFSEEPHWLQGFRERRRPSKPKKQAGFQETSVTVFCIRQRAPSGWETIPADFFPCGSQLLPAHFWHGLPTVSLRGEGSAFSSYNWEGKMQKKLTFPLCTGNCPSGASPGKLQSFARELSQPSISLAALSAPFMSQAVGQVEDRAVCFLMEQALVCMYRNKLRALLSSVFTGPV